MNFIRQLFSTRKHPYIPGYKKRENITINFSGSMLKLELPYHTAFDSFDKDKQPPSVVNLYQDSDFINHDDSSPEWQRMGESGRNVIPSRDLGFIASPWHISDRYGGMTFGMGLSRVDNLPKAMSLFNPRHLEQASMRLAYFTGPTEPAYRHVIGPVNWRVQETKVGTWIYYEQHPCPEAFKSRPDEATFLKTAMMIPLSHRHYLCLSIDGSGGAGSTGYYPHFDLFLKHFHAIKESVINSLHLELSEQAQAQLNDARQRWPNDKASEHREPEPWVYPKWRYGEPGKGEPDIVILEPGCPPPAYTP